MEDHSAGNGNGHGHSGPGKRGRKQVLADRESGPVAEFAHELGLLKVSAGDPSYERMRAELGATASKSALSAAARGRSCPSWETTWEFVRSLTPPDADLDAERDRWLARWEAARQPLEGCCQPPPTKQPPRRRLAVGLLVGAAAVGLVGVVGAKSGSDGPPVPPITGDAVKFVTDVTIPDGTVVAPGSQFVKTWELRNNGTVRWTGRFLMRLPDVDGEACRTTGRVPVPDTAPGRPVRVSVTVDAPSEPAACKVRWKMVDGEGRAYFPFTRPVYFEVKVAG